MSPIRAFAAPDPFDCDQLQYTFPGYDFSPYHEAIALRGGLWGIPDTANRGVIGAGAFGGSASASVIIQALSENQYKVTLRKGSSAEGKFLVQCGQVPGDHWSTYIWAAPTPISSLGEITAVDNIASINYVQGGVDSVVYGVTTTGQGVGRIRHSIRLRTIEFVAGGGFNNPSGYINPIYQDTSTIYALSAGKLSSSNLNKSAASKSPTTSGNPNHKPETHTEDPVDIFSGSFTIQNVDLAAPGILQPQTARLYHSAFAEKDGPFGKGTALLPYNTTLTVKKDASGHVVKAAGTELIYSAGDHTEVALTDTTGTLTFTAKDKTGFVDSTITVQTDSQGNMIGATLRKANGDAFLFDADGYLARIEDRNGNALAMTRDSEHHLVRVEDPSTQKGINFVYDENSHITQATGLNGQTISYTYDEQGRLSQIANPLGESVSFAYDDKHQIVSTTDARGIQVVQNTYNNDGQVIDQVMGDGSTMHMDYLDETTRKITDGTGDIRTHHFNAQGLFTGLTTPLNQEYKITYSPALFDTSGGPRTITNTDPQGRTVITELNALNQPIRITDQAGRVTELTYEPTFSLLASIKDPLGRITRFTYDTRGNVIQTEDPEGNQSTFTYNTQGQVLSATDAMGQTVQYCYNPNHDLTQVKDPLGNQTTYAYDSLSRLTEITDPKGNKTTYTYDLLNRVTKITDALGHTTAFVYDENGNVVSVTDPKGQTTTASYDPMNRLVSTTNAKGETATLSYDGDGHVISSTDPKGQTTQYTYNAVDQVTEVTYADGTDYQYSYDNVNRLTDISDGSGQWHFAYDILDRLIAENTPEGSLNYTYDTVSRLTGFSAPNSQYAPVQYAYDALDRITGITQSGKTYGYTYDAIGRRTALTRPNEVESVYEYDANSRLLTLSHTKGTRVLERHQYSYDPNGNIQQYVRGTGTAKAVIQKPCGRKGKGTLKQLAGYVEDQAETLTRNYTYDALNRLTDVNALGMVESASHFKSRGQQLAASVLINQARRTHNARAKEALLRNAEQLGAVLPENASWTFDANGNLASKTLHTLNGDQETTYAYDEADRLIEILRPVENSPTTRRHHRHPMLRHGARYGHQRHGSPIAQTEAIELTYDANGNLISDETGRTFTWNAQDQLIQLHTPDVSANFAYDPLGRRTRYNNGSTLKTYFYQGQSILSDGHARYLDGIGIDEHLQIDTHTGSRSYLPDHLGSTSQLVDSINGSAKARYDYTSYGTLEGEAETPLSVNPYTYTGREDDGTGLMYYRARYYDPELEVFISQDPLGDAQRYAGNNPIKYKDPMGLDYWIENSVEGEGGMGFHQSLCVGQYGGDRSCYSFGANSQEASCLFNCPGSVYKDTSRAGSIDFPNYVFTSPSIDRQIRKYLEPQIGKSGGYGLVLNNCRTYSHNTFNDLRRIYGGIPYNGKNTFQKR